ncbi:NUDIX domain-containing protein [Hoeflea sp. TYP-13]|uniref:NUDIX domain-containing protein n=1 Tax=Hoeflea sp. TYP-13 TaxID=3230023 RepID=UPI0034C68E58
MTIRNRVRVRETRNIHKGWSSLNQATIDFQRSDGSWQTMVRDNFDCGHGATVLLYNLDRRTVILVRQFRYSVFCDGYEELIIETPAGLLDDASPEERIRAEAEEETGYRVQSVRKVFEAYVSPGAVSQKNICFVGAYSPEDRVSDGGGLAEEGEDIEVLEMEFDEAYAMISDGRIRDGKTIMLLQYAALNLFAA